MRFTRIVATGAASAILATGIGLSAVAANNTPLSALASGAGLRTAALPAANINGTSPSGYKWGNVEIVGGGFVPGIIFNQTEPGLVYARTDIGGAYRLDEASQRWKPLTDHIGWDDWSHSGILSLATDPVDTDRVYLAAGTYTNSWDTQNGAILRSTDRGETWAKTMLPFKVGGNMPGRGMGERLSIDPNKNNILYYGAESGNGLWKSTDYGVTWAQVANFPNVGNYVQDASYDYTGDNQGVVWVTFDPTTGSATQATQTIYVGVADKDNNVYRSTNGGATWERVAGQPTGFLAQKGVLDHEGQQLYIATSDTGGPYDGSLGDVWRLDIATGTWTQISPIPSSSADAYFGYSGLTIDRENPDTIMAVSQISWWPDIIIYRSTDRGNTWTRIWDWDGYPSKTKRYTMDYSSVPWHDFGNTASLPDENPKLGWMTQSFEIDPHNPDRFYYGTGGGIYGGTNLTAWDNGGKVAITPKAQGIEETAIQDLEAPPGATELISGMFDIGGFVHTDISTVPSKYFMKQPHHDSVISLDFAQANPNIVVRTGKSISGETSSWVGISNDGGNNWHAANKPASVTGPGYIAVNTNASSVVWAPEGTAPLVSSTMGSTWTAVTGLPEGAHVEADRVDANKFYAFAGGQFYYSTNKGASFTASSFDGFPAEGNVRFRAVPGHDGHVWLAGGMADETYGMWRSTDGGLTWVQMANVQEGDSIGFGKAETAGGYPIIYTASKIGNVRGIFRSADQGATWQRLNDDQNQWYWSGNTIQGDPDVTGRVYIGTNGRGIIVGDVSNFTPTQSFTGGTVGGSTPEPTPTTTSPEPTPTTTTPDPTPTTTTPEPTPTTTSPEPTPTSTAPTGACSAAYSTTGNWGAGFQGQIAVTANSAITSWNLSFNLGGATTNNVWGGKLSGTASSYTISNEAWNGGLGVNQTATVGFIGNGSAPASVSISCK